MARKPRTKQLNLPGKEFQADPLDEILGPLMEDYEDLKREFVAKQKEMEEARGTLAETMKFHGKKAYMFRSPKFSTPIIAEFVTGKEKLVSKLDDGEGFTQLKLDKEQSEGSEDGDGEGSAAPDLTDEEKAMAAELAGKEIEEAA